MWDLADGKPRKLLEGHKGGIEAIAFSKDGRWIATGGRSAKEGVHYEVIVWDARTGDSEDTFPDLTEWVLPVAFFPVGKTLTVSGGRHRPEGEAYKTSGEIRFIPLEYGCCNRGGAAFGERLDLRRGTVLSRVQLRAIITTRS